MNRNCSISRLGVLAMTASLATIGSDALAGIVWHSDITLPQNDGDTSYFQSSVLGNVGGGSYSASGASAMDAGSASYGNTSFSYTGVSGNSFSVSDSPGDYNVISSIDLFFTVTGGDVQATMTVHRNNMGNYDTAWVAMLGKWNPAAAWGAGAFQYYNLVQRNSAGTQTVTLGAGTYRVRVNTENFMGSGSVASFSVVPAPGAVALIGLAGAFAGRRRRA